jgi:hypothetical protein
MYYKYSGAYVKRRIDELKSKWFSSRCFLKLYQTDSNGRELALTALNKIKKDDLVALFADKENITPNAHYIRHSETPTCYLSDNEVFASTNIEPETELTINYNLRK